MSATDHDEESGRAWPSPLALRLTLGAAGALLLGACALLWARFGSLVFLDAAATLWKTCF